MVYSTTCLFTYSQEMASSGENFQISSSAENFSVDEPVKKIYLMLAKSTNPNQLKECADTVRSLVLMLSDKIADEFGSEFARECVKDFLKLFLDYQFQAVEDISKHAEMLVALLDIKAAVKEKQEETEDEKVGARIREICTEIRSKACKAIMGDNMITRLKQLEETKINELIAEMEQLMIKRRSFTTNDDLCTKLAIMTVGLIERDDRQTEAIEAFMKTTSEILRNS